MQIVTDRAMDLADEQLKGFQLHYAPLRFTLDGRTYRSGEDILPDEFYRLLSETESYPTTSLPSAGEFAALYRELARADAEILSIHVSSGLSGTIEAARAGAAMVPEAKVTFFDTLTLSCPMGWQVEAALRAVKAGWPLKKVLELLEQVRQRTFGMYTVPMLKYLIHGGRISHIKGLLASVLNIKPIITVDKVTGKYVQVGQEITVRRAINRMAETVTHWFPEGSRMRFQLLHGHNFEGTFVLKERLEQLFECTFEAPTSIAPVLGAHTGPGLVGLAFGPAELLEMLP